MVSCRETFSRYGSGAKISRAELLPHINGSVDLFRKWHWWLDLAVVLMAKLRTAIKETPVGKKLGNGLAGGKEIPKMVFSSLSLSVMLVAKRRIEGRRVEVISFDFCWVFPNYAGAAPFPVLILPLLYARNYYTNLWDASEEKRNWVARLQTREEHARVRKLCTTPRRILQTLLHILQSHHIARRERVRERGLGRTLKMESIPGTDRYIYVCTRAAVRYRWMDETCYANDPNASGFVGLWELLSVEREMLLSMRVMFAQSQWVRLNIRFEYQAQNLSEV